MVGFSLFVFLRHPRFLTSRTSLAFHNMAALNTWTIYQPNLSVTTAAVDAAPGTVDLQRVLNHFFPCDNTAVGDLPHWGSAWLSCA
jgi:phage tail protein X